MNRVREAKAALRQEMRQRRDALSPAVRDARGRRVHDRVLRHPDVASADCVLLFSSIRSEIPTLSIVNSLVEHGSRILLPRVEGNDLAIYEVPPATFDALVRSPFGVPEPDPSVHARRQPDEVSLALVPGLAFDLHGNRLGYGKGFYDRLLSRISPDVPAWGLSFDFQVLRSIPSGAADVPVRGTITERAVYRRLEWTFRTRGEDETMALARAIGESIRSRGGDPGERLPLLFALVGDLGTGKTRFAQGLAEGLGCEQAATSPTFVLAQEYDGELPLRHLDLYRLASSPTDDDLRYLEELLAMPGVVVVEWAERCMEHLPRETVEVAFEQEGESERSIRVVIHTGTEFDRLGGVLNAWSAAR